VTKGLNFSNQIMCKVSQAKKVFKVTNQFDRSE